MQKSAPLHRRPVVAHALEIGHLGAVEAHGG